MHELHVQRQVILRVSAHGARLQLQKYSADLPPVLRRKNYWVLISINVKRDHIDNPSSRNLGVERLEDYGDFSHRRPFLVRI